MKYTVRVTDGHCVRDIEIATVNGVEEAARSRWIGRSDRTGRRQTLLGSIRD
jgi:hypothetical protein